MIYYALKKLWQKKFKIRQTQVSRNCVLRVIFPFLSTNILLFILKIKKMILSFSFCGFNLALCLIWFMADTLILLYHITCRGHGRLIDRITFFQIKEKWGVISSKLKYFVSSLENFSFKNEPNLTRLWFYH